MAVETIIHYRGYEQLEEVHMFGFNDIEVETLVGATDGYPEILKMC